MLLTVVAFVVVIGIIVTIHELGHFLGARLTGMRVKRFSIGFPPKMISKKIGSTEYILSWIPLGGYVQIAGMIDESLDESDITGAPDEFMSKNPLQKIFVLCAGVLMNYLLAVFLIAGLVVALGIAEPRGARVGEVIEKLPAAAAGVMKGDEFTAIDGHPVATWDDVVKAISSARDTVQLTIRREGAGSLVFAVPTQVTEQLGGKRRVIGVSPVIERRSATVWEAIAQGGIFCFETSVGVGRFLAGLFTGESRLSQLSGPLGVAKLSGESAREGSGAFLFFIAYVSVSIGFLQLLPLPVLDGGHVVYVLIEAIRRRPIPAKSKVWIQQVGWVLLIVLVVFISYHDIARILAH